MSTALVSFSPGAHRLLAALRVLTVRYVPDEVSGGFSVDDLTLAAGMGCNEREAGPMIEELYEAGLVEMVDGRDEATHYKLKEVRA